jgi:protein SCO1
VTPDDGRTTPEPAPAAGGPRPGRVALLVVLVALVLGAAAVAVTAAGRTADPAVAPDDDTEGWHGALLGEPQPRPDFTLTDTEGRPYDFRTETGGRLTLLFFGYTSCPDVCPIHMATLSSALGQPGMPDPVVVFVTTDPERDTPERLRSWLDNFGTDFVGLTGTPEEIAAAEDAAGIARSIVAAEASSGDDYEVGHAAQIIAYAPDDQAHLQYPFGVRRQDWMADLPRIVETWGEQVVTVDGGWAAADDQITAVYLTIENAGPDDRLIGAETGVAGEITTMGPGTMPAGGGSGATGAEDDTSTAVDVEVPAGTTALEPGGTHLMLELTRAVAPGEQIDLRLTFAGAGAVDVPVEILDWDEVAERAAER